MIVTGSEIVMYSPYLQNTSCLMQTCSVYDTVSSLPLKLPEKASTIGCSIFLKNSFSYSLYWSMRSMLGILRLKVLSHFSPAWHPSITTVAISRDSNGIHLYSL